MKAETFAKPSDVDAVQGVAAQRVQTYHIDRQTSEQRTTQKCAADGGFAKVSSYLNAFACVDVEENTQSHQINQALIKPSGQILIPTIRAATPFKAESFASVKKQIF